MARAGGRIADIFNRASDMADGAMSRVQWITDAKKWALDKLESARGALPFARTKRILSSMIDDTLKPGQLEDFYTDLPQHFGSSPYVRDRMDTLEQLVKECAEQGKGSSPCRARDGHWSNIRGEFRETRLRSWTDSTYGGSSRISNHDVNGNGWDDFRDIDAGTGNGDRKYVFGESKDTLNEGGMGPGDLRMFMTGSPPRFNRTGFETRLNQLLSDGVIDATEQADILKALDEGRIEIVVFGGGNNRPFTSTVTGVSALAQDGTLPDGSARPDVPVRVHIDK
jgi:hypothetical protein